MTLEQLVDTWSDPEATRVFEREPHVATLRHIGRAVVAARIGALQITALGMSVRHSLHELEPEDAERVDALVASVDGPEAGASLAALRRWLGAPPLNEGRRGWILDVPLNRALLTFTLPK